MKATIYMDDLRRIVKQLKPFCADASFSTHHSFIKMRFRASEQFECIGRAYATNGRIAAVEEFHFTADEDFEFFLRPSEIERFKGAEAVIATRDGNAMILDADGISVRYEVENPDKFIDIDAKFPDKEPAFRIGLNAKYLMTALKSMQDSRFNYFSEIQLFGELEPAVMKSKTGARLIMPIRLRSESRSEEDDA